MSSMWHSTIEMSRQAYARPALQPTWIGRAAAVAFLIVIVLPLLLLLLLAAAVAMIVFTVLALVNRVGSVFRFPRRESRGAAVPSRVNPDDIIETVGSSDSR